MEKHMIQVNMPDRYGGFSVLSKLKVGRYESIRQFRAKVLADVRPHSQMRANDVSHGISNVNHARDRAAFSISQPGSVSSRSKASVGTSGHSRISSSISTRHSESLAYSSDESRQDVVTKQKRSSIPGRILYGHTGERGQDEEHL